MARITTARKLGAATATVIFAVALAACGGSPHAVTTTTSTGALAAAARGDDPTAPSARVVRQAKTGAKRLSSGVVATVAAQPISLAAYRRQYQAQLSSLASAGVPLDPPGFDRCAAGLAKSFTRLGLPHGARAKVPTHAQLVMRCRLRLAGIKQTVMVQLIQQRWLAGEAKAQGVQVSDAAVDRLLARQQQALGGAAKYSAYLARSGQTREHMAATLRLMLTEQQLQQRQQGPLPAVTNQQVAAYFAAHRAEFKLAHQPNPKFSTYAARIKLLLQSQARAQRAAATTTEFQRRWRAQTVCAPGYVVPLCANWTR